ncbi:hypothetical protein Tco_0177913 [Tanacetum coccineum]
MKAASAIYIPSGESRAFSSFQVDSQPYARSKGQFTVILLIHQPQCATSAFLEASLSEPRTEPRIPAQYLVPTCHHVIGATWSVIKADIVTGATTGPPVNGGQRRRSTVPNDGQRWRTTVRPSPDLQSTIDQRWLTASQQAG